MFLKLSVLCLLVQAITCQVDYCNKALCISGSHIACNNTGAFSKTCITPFLVPLSQVDKNNFVDLHNTLRNKLASGNLIGFQPAVRMASMVWDDSLAKNAELNVKTCKFEHDTCRNTPVFKASGQSIYMGLNLGPYVAKVNASITQAVNMWFDEYKFANQTNMDNLIDYKGIGGNVIGHFLPLAIARNTHVGCAYSTYAGTYLNYGAVTYHLITCNYATMAYLNQFVYKKGPVPASGCLTGKNPRFTSLCSITEKIDPNTN